MAILPVTGALPSASTLAPATIGENADASAVGGMDATPTTGAGAFGNVIDGLQALQGQSQDLAVEAVTGGVDDVHTATIAATRAQVTLELVAAVRNKGVDAFNEIMRMQA